MALQSLRFYLALMSFILTYHPLSAEENPFQQEVKSPCFLIEVQNHSVWDEEYIQARQPELSLIRQKVNELIQHNFPCLIKHYASCVKNYIDLWKCARNLIEMMDSNNLTLFQEGPSQQNLGGSWQGAREMICDSELSDEEKGKLIDYTNCYVRHVLARDPLFSQFRTDLRSHLVKPGFRTQVYQHVSLLILKKVIKLKKQIQDWEIIPSTHGSSSEHDIQVFNGTNIITPPRLYTTDPTDAAGFLLCEVINELNAKRNMKKRKILDLTAISQEEICLIHNKIQKNKEKNTWDWDVLEFIREPGGLAQLIACKNTLPRYRGKLFYDFSEIYNVMND
jgi:hypothetical protein